MSKNVDWSAVLYESHSYNVNLDTREIYLHSHFEAGDDHGDEGGVEFKMATQFVKNLNILKQKSNKPVLIHMQSPGGSWIHGMAIYDAIKCSGLETTILVYGEASSMSGVILQAATHRVLMPNAEFLIHHIVMGMEATSQTMMSHAASSLKHDDVMFNIFAERAKASKFFLNNFNTKTNGVVDLKEAFKNSVSKNGDWILDAQEAVYFGLADKIYNA